jgi:galactokinase
MQISNDSLRADFVRMFGAGGRVRVVRAPGRVNLIGEHTDYNAGFVFPMAIEPEIRIACRAREDNLVRFASTLFPGEGAEFSIADKIERGLPKWSNYIRGVAAQLKAAGIPVTGMDALMTNTLPDGGGLSSSAAVEVGTAHAFIGLVGYNIEPMRLALLCQKAEHEYAGVPCGIMDQMIVANAQLGSAMLFDCRSYQRRPIPMNPADLRVVIANTMVRHDLTGADGKSAYAQRREQCEAGVAWFKQQNPSVKSLRDVTPAMIAGAEGKLDEVILRRCRHIVGETQRCQDAASALVAKDYDLVGRLMNESHFSLDKDYEVSCEELNFMSGEARAFKGVYGARMTGGGFGGCIVALVQPRQADALMAHLRESYKAKNGIDPVVFGTTATSGAGMME